MLNPTKQASFQFGVDHWPHRFHWINFRLFYSSPVNHF